MPVTKEEKTVQRKKTTTWYECDMDCDVRSEWREDLNCIPVNPRTNTPTTKLESDDYSHDGWVILCDDHLDELQSLLDSELGIAFTQE